MKKKFKLGVIGAGFMSTAIVQGIINSNSLEPSEIIVSDVLEQSLEKAKKLGVNVTLDNAFLVENCEFVLFAVKPQSFNAVVSGLNNAKCNKIISIMAGVKKSTIKKYFINSAVARCMPNTPCAIGSGAVGIDVLDFTDQADKDFISKIFSSIANVVFVEESKLNAVTGVSGSSPAYFYLFLKGIVEAGVKNGLTEEEALNLASATMIGAGKMVLTNKDKSLDELISAVCSKGGTTIEAVKVFNEKNINSIIDQAIDACIKRSKELENL
ncbi:MAG: pyrroline-5-carboxylate reductase [Clostridia bacterium]|nr:pyrroline-5-carboxylate reductase [Clostridia bacterium]